MKVFTQEFVSAVQDRVNKMDKSRLTREMLMTELGVEAQFAPVVAVLLEAGLVTGVQSRKGRGLVRSEEATDSSEAV